MMSEPLITVIIPTRERSDVLYHSLKTLTAQKYEDLRIIVSDNASKDRTSEVVKSFNDARIQYINPGKRISMSHNWEFALSHVREGWVGFLGDDDGFLPGALNNVAAAIISTDCKAIRYSTCNYTWPGVGASSSGRMQVPLTSGFATRSSTKWIGKVLSGVTSYTELPTLYNGGFAEVEFLKSLYRNDKFFHSCTPDVYSGLVIAEQSEDYLRAFEPIAVNGASRHSNGTSFFTARNPDQEKPAEMFLREENIPFHTLVPLLPDGRYPRSLQAIIYEAYLQVMDIFQRPPATSPELQLGYIIRDASGATDWLPEWVESFAARNRIPRKCMPLTSARKQIHSLRKYIEVLLQAPKFWGIGDDDLPINDVYQAAIVAGTVKRIAPGWMKNSARILRKQFIGNAT